MKDHFFIISKYDTDSGEPEYFADFADNTLDGVDYGKEIWKKDIDEAGAFDMYESAKSYAEVLESDYEHVLEVICCRYNEERNVIPLKTFWVSR